MPVVCLSKVQKTVETWARWSYVFLNIFGLSLTCENYIIILSNIRLKSFLHQTDEEQMKNNRTGVLDFSRS